MPCSNASSQQPSESDYSWACVSLLLALATTLLTIEILTSPLRYLLLRLRRRNIKPSTPQVSTPVPDAIEDDFDPQDTADVWIASLDDPRTDALRRSYLEACLTLDPARYDHS